jgi:tRNA(Met) C34 N-acetyltransferase TmcA
MRTSLSVSKITIYDDLILYIICADLSSPELNFLLSPFDLKRLESYANNMLDYHVVVDLLPAVASLYFEKRLGSEIRLSAVQSSILLALGLQRKTIEEVEVSDTCISFVSFG